jgi:hypothetical protein
MPEGCLATLANFRAFFDEVARRRHCPAWPGNLSIRDQWLLDRPVKPGDDSMVTT